MQPTFFRTAAALRRWLEKHHASSNELWIGMYKKATGKQSVTYREALDEALCFGWIDGVRKRLDDEAFVQRFTPRRPDSRWSVVNIARASELIEAGRMRPAGLAAYERRDARAAERLSHERQHAALDRPAERTFRANAKAWAYFQAEAPWYRRVVLHWVTSAKQEETRRRRLERLIAECAAGERIGILKKKPPRATR